jgi:uncharacterized protein YecE (DUF72 family)
VPAAENKANLEAFLQRLPGRAGPRQGQLLAREPGGPWQADGVGELCRCLGLVHCVDPFVAEPTHRPVAYFGLHGRGDYDYRYTEGDLRHLRDLCRRQQELGRTTVYCLFSNVHMRDDALRFRSLHNVAAHHGSSERRDWEKNGRLSRTSM